jgi:hypothetical protein
MSWEDTERHMRTVHWHNEDDWVPSECFMCHAPGSVLVRHSIQNEAFPDERDSWRCQRCGTMIKRECRYTGKPPEEK